MKKHFMIPAAIAALMGVGAYFGHAAATPADESDLLLANAEALAEGEIDLPGVEIVCDGPESKGRCWYAKFDWDTFAVTCVATGNPDDFCDL